MSGLQGLDAHITGNWGGDSVGDDATLPPDGTARPAIDYTRWLDFATRMARHGWPNATQARKSLLVGEITEFLGRYDPSKDNHEPIYGWDGNLEPPGRDIWDYAGDVGTEFHTHFWNYEFDDGKRRARRQGSYFIDQLACCIRAGLNVAGDENSGVVGFDVGLLRRMYDGALPDWLIDRYDSAQDEPHKSIRDAADTEAIWL